MRLHAQVCVCVCVRVQYAYKRGCATSLVILKATLMYGYVYFSI